MQTLQELFTRAENECTAVMGQAAPYEPFYIYVDQTAPDPETAFQVRYGLVGVSQGFEHAGDGKTYLKYIETKWQKYFINPAGMVINYEGKPLGQEDWMISNAKDMQDFMSFFGEDIARFIINGAVRRFMWWGSNNFQPVFAADRSRIPDTQYNTKHVGNPAWYMGWDKQGKSLDGDASKDMDISESLAPVA